VSTSWQAPSPEPAGTPNAPSGCVSVLLVIIGIIMLLPGLCVVGFMIADRTLIPSEGSIVTLWIICLAISAVGIYVLIAVARRARRSTPP
jgi:hypothetical protein